MKESEVIARLQQLAATAEPESGIEMALRHIEHLELAIEHRTVLGQATGILMERYQMDSDAAFAVLTRLSSAHNVKLYVLAEELVTKRHIYDL